MTQSTLTAQLPAVASSLIEGVYHVPIRAFADDRGQFMESFRKEWFPQVSWEKFQTNRSDSRAGVLRGLHYHFHQVDYWYVPKGSIRAAMVDLRPNSSTYLATEVIEMGEVANVGLFIPVGVAHGFYALTDCTLMYIVNNYYGDGSDERGVAWDDPALGVDWRLDGATPILSQRDIDNRRLHDIPTDALPK